MSKKDNNIDNKNNSTNIDSEDIEVVIGDESIIQISEVGDCMNRLRPKDSVTNRKNFIIPVVKNAKKDSSNSKDEDNNSEKNKKSPDKNDLDDSTDDTNK